MKIASKATLAAAMALTGFTALSAFAASTVTLDGWVSDSKCGADHGAKDPDPDCVGKCIRGGAKPVFVDGNNKVWAIDDPDVVKGHYGHHVSVVATVDPAKNEVHITKVTMLADQGGK
jgi:hypothetical protein